MEFWGYGRTNSTVGTRNYVGIISTVVCANEVAVRIAARPIKDVVPYGNKPSANGLVMVDSPAREPELLTALAAAGAHIIIFTTGRGAPQGFPFVPVIKVTGNQRVAKTMKEHIDLYLDIREKNDPELVVNKILDLVISIAGGQLTKAKALGYHTGDIAVKGPIM